MEFSWENVQNIIKIALVIFYVAPIILVFIFFLCTGIKPHRRGRGSPFIVSNKETVTIPFVPLENRGI